MDNRLDLRDLPIGEASVFLNSLFKLIINNKTVIFFGIIDQMYFVLKLYEIKVSGRIIADYNNIK